MKVLLIIEIILIFLKIILHKYVRKNYWELKAMGSRMEDIYAWINFFTYVICLVTLILLVVKFIN
jgi:hypothetical protein